MPSLFGGMRDEIPQCSTWDRSPGGGSLTPGASVIVAKTQEVQPTVKLDIRGLTPKP